MGLSLGFSGTPTPPTPGVHVSLRKVSGLHPILLSRTSPVARAGYAAGDPYLAFAKAARLVPEDATKASHKAMRDRCKVIVLGIGYGMEADSMAVRARCWVGWLRTGRDSWPLSDEALNPLLQMLLGGEVAAAEEFADQDREPNLDLIEPSRHPHPSYPRSKSSIPTRCTSVVSDRCGRGNMARPKLLIWIFAGLCAAFLLAACVLGVAGTNERGIKAGPGSYRSRTR